MSLKKISLIGLSILITLLSVISYFLLSGAPKPKADDYWNISQENRETSINHDEWQYLLEEYLITDEPDKVNLMDYEGIQDNDKDRLYSYIEKLSEIDPRQYNRAEQKSYWINLYNALTVQLIVENYPIDSITKLGKTTLSFGPWDDQIVIIADKALSLNDIEHRILRPLWKDHRIHFAVNCASIGCPNLQEQAYTAGNTEELLNQGAVDYLEHPRGLRYEEGTLYLSSIFEWYGDDFGHDQAQLLNALSVYLNDESARDLKNYSGNIKYEYNWQLNGF